LLLNTLVSNSYQAIDSSSNLPLRQELCTPYPAYLFPIMFWLIRLDVGFGLLSYSSHTSHLKLPCWCACRLPAAHSSAQQRCIMGDRSWSDVESWSGQCLGFCQLL